MLSGKRGTYWKYKRAGWEPVGVASRELRGAAGTIFSVLEKLSSE
jgi:hypothetical protein